jgi:glycosyltransferase involved in cell wall biosynthesis
MTDGAVDTNHRQTVVWRGHPHAAAPLAEIRAARRRGPTRVCDEAGNPIAFGAWKWSTQLLRTLWQRMHLALLGVDIALLASRDDKAPAEAGQLAGKGPVVLVVPVLPDVSHTFVYREVLALLDERPDWRVVVLARNESAPMHAEAQRLLQRATFLLCEGITRTFWRSVWGLYTNRRVRRLFGLYRNRPRPQDRQLIGKETPRDPRHPGNALLLASVLKPLDPSHIHVYSSTWPANVAMGAALLLDRPFSISSYVDFEFDYSHRMLREKLARATFFRVVTAFCARVLQSLSPDTAVERIPVVYLGLDLADWSTQSTWQRNGALLSAARLVEKKGLHLMPEAIRLLRERGIEVRWRVIGSGPELTRLQRLCSEHEVTDQVTFLGARDNEVVRLELERAAAAVLPCVVADDKERDGIPIFFVEAMAIGIPVVTAPISGIPELIEAGRTGFLHEPGNAADLADQIAQLLTDEERTRAIATRGREAVHRTMDVRRSAQQLIKHIER